MSWSEFYIVVSGLITFVLLIVTFPWLRRKNHAQQDSLSNTQIVKQRLAELDREVQEGLISEHDKRQAVDELKLALVDESAFQSKRTGTATLPLLVGGIVALMHANGGITWLIQRLTRKVTTKKGAEFSIAGLVSFLDITTANNTIAIVTAGPIAKDLNGKYGVDPRRTASLRLLWEYHHWRLRHIAGTPC